jgi:hypothetical protein
MDELRDRLRRAEDDARAARYLAGGADRDTVELRAEVREFRAEMRGFRDQNNRVLSAMREDLTDLRGDLTGLRGDLTGLRNHVDDGFARIAEEFAQVDRNFTAIRGVLDATAAGQQQIVELLDVAMRQRDDRPDA